MKKSLAVLFGLMCLVSVFVTCSTDFELNVPEETTVIFGVLDESADTQWIKVKKSFLGNGNNFAYAAINDCTQYDNVTVTVEENGGLNRLWTLSEKYVPVNNSGGIFYTDSQKVYYFVPGSLDGNATYTVKAEFDDNRPVVEATTSLVGSFDFTGIFKAKLFSGLDFENGAGLASPSYVDQFLIDWSTGTDAKRYDLTIRFNYDEHSVSGVVTSKYIDWFQGTQISTTTVGGIQMDRTINAELFFTFLQTNSELIDTTGVAKRVIENVEFILTAAHDELNTYIEINEPVSGIVTERPTYTNVTNGIGLFSSRAKRVLDRASPLTPLTKFKEKTIQELSRGQYTNALLFCSDSAAYSAEAYYCP
ncbi:MAG: DUF4249 family protein [Flavobacteriales bacterium]|nr:DUF4249 family protein [Flavobacteriales bacterium]